MYLAVFSSIYVILSWPGETVGYYNMIFSNRPDLAETLVFAAPHPYPRQPVYAAKHAHHSQIVRMLNDVSFAKKNQGGSDSGGVDEVDLCPASLEKEIDDMNEFVYEKVSHARC